MYRIFMYCRNTCSSTSVRIFDAELSSAMLCMPMSARMEDSLRQGGRQVSNRENTCNHLIC